MESKTYSIIAISSIFAFALIALGAWIIPTTFVSVLAQGKDSSLQSSNMTGISQDQTSSGESTAFNPVMISVIIILRLQQIVVAEKECLENILHLGW